MSERLSLPGFSRRQPDDSTTVLPATREKPRPRHSKVRLALAGLGTFLVATALLLEFYVAPQLIAAPVSFNQTDVLTATNASYYNAGILQTKQDTHLTYTLTIRSDAASSSHTTAVWESSAVLMDPATKYTVNVVTQRAAFNRRTGELSNCCGASLNGDTRVRQTGIGQFWPINTQKTTYQVFDPNSGHAFPATYAGTATVGGVAAYRFVQHVPPTVAQEMAGIPVSILGLPGDRECRGRPLLAGRQHVLGQPADRRPRQRDGAGPVGAARPRRPGQARGSRPGPDHDPVHPSIS